MTSPMVYIGGRPVQSMGKWGDLHIVDRWPYGCWELSFGISVKPYQRIQSLVGGVLVEARVGSRTRWAGFLSQPNWDTGQLIALGMVRQGEAAITFNGAGTATTATPDTAVDGGIARGVLNWVRRTSLSAVSFAADDTTQNINYVTPLLDVWSNSAGMRWGVNAQREVYAAADPTVPSFSVHPGAGEMGLSSGSQVGKIYGAYQSLTGATGIVTAGSGAPEVGVGLFNYGPIDSTRAQSIINGIYAQVQPKASFTNGVTVTPDLVTTMGGQRLGLESAVAGKMARALGLRDDRGVLVSPVASPTYINPTGGAPAATDFVVGESNWNVDEGTVALLPVAIDNQTLAGAVEDAGGELLS